MWWASVTVWLRGAGGYHFLQTASSNLLLTSFRAHGGFQPCRHQLGGQSGIVHALLVLPRLCWWKLCNSDARAGVNSSLCLLLSRREELWPVWSQVAAWVSVTGTWLHCTSGGRLGRWAAELGSWISGLQAFTYSGDWWIESFGLTAVKMEGAQETSKIFKENLMAAYHSAAIEGLFGQAGSFSMT